MKNKLSYALLFLLIILITIPLTTTADTGPKPSVVISFEGLENEKYYVALLSESITTGPHTAYDEQADNSGYYGDEKDNIIWQKFVSYKDEDGFYFLQFFEDCTETSKFTWGYYPPTKFKILIYFPEHDSFVVSNEVYERYAFDSYYKVNAAGLEIQNVDVAKGIQAEKDYVYSLEISSLIFRILLTIVIEVIIAMLFGFREKKQLLIIVAINIITQTILNILLNLINYNQGGSMFVFHYIWIELIVIVIEAVAYYLLFKKYSNSPKGKFVTSLYAFIANISSFVMGALIANVIPGIF